MPEWHASAASSLHSDGDRLAFAALRAAESSGRVLGSSEFVAALERANGRRLRPKKPGREPRAPTDQRQLRMRGISGEGRESGNG
jgi:putative transposase